MATTITYFVHGTTIDNEHDLATGWQPGELSAAGRQQAVELGKLVEHTKFDAFFTSDLDRAIESSQLGFGKRYPIIQDRRLRECDYGDFTEHPASEFKNRLEDYVDSPFPHGESYRNVEKRLRSLVEMVQTRYADQQVAFLAHQAPQLALDVILGGKTWPEAINQDWRRRKAWQPGWMYTLRD